MREVGYGFRLHRALHERRDGCGRYFFVICFLKKSVGYDILASEVVYIKFKKKKRDVFWKNKTILSRY
jgi:hypothetical protein